MIETNALREKVLDLAIRGKLVPQNPNDEPASVLLERIRAEKQQMVKDGKLKAKDIKNDTIIFKGEDNLHYEKFQDGTIKCIEDEIPFEIPSSWSWARLGAISEAIGDGDHQPPPQTLTGVPFLVISNVSNGKLSFTETRFVSNEYYDSLPESRKPQNGDLLFTVTGSYGIPVLVDTDIQFCFQRHIAIIHPCIITNHYLYVVLGSAYIKSFCDAKATGVAQRTVSLTTLRDMLIPIAPLSEQANIFAQAEMLLQIIEEITFDQKDLLETIATTKTRILNLAIRGRLVPQDPEDEPASVLLERIHAEKEELIKQGKIKRDKKESFIFRGDDNSYYEKIGNKAVCIDNKLPFSIPQNWSWCRLPAISDIIMGSSPDGTTIISNGDGMEFHQGKLFFTDKIIDRSNTITTEPSKVAEANSVLLCVRAPVGEVNITNRQICIGRGLSSIHPTKEIDVHFLFYWLQTYKQYLNIQATGSTFVAITADVIKTLLIPLPPIDEQKVIKKTIDISFAMLNDIEKSLS